MKAKIPTPAGLDGLQIALVIGAATPPGRLVEVICLSAAYARSMGTARTLLILEKYGPNIVTVGRSANIVETPSARSE
jgi:hypothetical protein